MILYKYIMEKFEIRFMIYNNSYAYTDVKMIKKILSQFCNAKGVLSINQTDKR